MIYRNNFINLISLGISILIFLILNFIFMECQKNPLENLNLQFIFEQEKTDDSTSNIDGVQNGEEIELGDWYIEIPSINLKAPIAEGTDAETLNTKVGHFTTTSLLNGNIGLAAHNRGYEYNYFQNLKDLKIDSEIKYYYEDSQRTYLVDTIEIIKNTDWSYLENTDENKITLITCVENETLYRRCIQATEK